MILNGVDKSLYDDFIQRGCSKHSIEEFLIDYKTDYDFAFELKGKDAVKF